MGGQGSGLYQQGRTGELSNAWKGATAGYRAVHKWMDKHYPKAGTCVECGYAGRTERASIDHTYTRDPNDWLELCKACHVRMDGGG